MSFLGGLADTFNTFLGSGRANEDGTDPIISRSDIVKEGWLDKESRNVRDWRRRYVVLTRDCLATFRAGPAELYRWSEATELINFGQMMTVRSADHETQRENSFCLQRQKDGKFFFFLASSSAEKEAWVGAVGRAMVRRTVMIDEDFAAGDDDDYGSSTYPIATAGSHGAASYDDTIDDHSSGLDTSYGRLLHEGAGGGASGGALFDPGAGMQHGMPLLQPPGGIGNGQHHLQHPSFAGAQHQHHQAFGAAQAQAAYNCQAAALPDI
mmetsp:Transcript_2021/g.4726  ORF Transcript_2021/g.4726 Transcript_2021/m.4726 type:complete len:267 (-) Transcript_2021:264-1064(-)|eukprot:CAMPEP_0178997388 /NCGR_PEP_ID=MMETSP0795-20121207/8895_1 /TAXON_ID=88552 /ORGANISM="Amoebophrya sp., Strain Ameob2" /LENGTH=266 /DNA_ID=CAMNT_0020689881 /DNA_START=241 /DNA_END=1041 /DNA_ORIENTATION=+